MSVSRLKKSYVFVNYCFGTVVAICSFHLFDVLIDALEASGTTVYHRGVTIDEGLPTYSLTMLLTLPMAAYYRKKNRTTLFTLGYIMYVCLAGLFFILYGHYKYAMEFGFFFIWVYHVIVCILILLWNLAAIIFVYHLEKMSS